MKYNKEEVMKAVSDLKCVNGAMYFGSVKEPCEGRKTGECCHNEQSFEEAEQELKSFLSTALDSAYKAGEEKVKNKIKECVNTCSDDISYLDSNSNNECIRIFKVNLEALK